MKNKTIIFLIFVLAFFLRAYKFGQIPFGVNRDEASLGYNSYSILKTGRDEHNQKFPIQFESFGDWKKPMYIYLSTIPIALLGLNEISTRLVSFIFSFIIMIFSIKIIKKIYKQKRKRDLVSIFALLFLTLSPWHFHFSRVALEVMVSVGFFTIGFYNYLQKKHILGTLFFIFSMFTYHSALITVPLWLLFYWALFVKKISIKEKLINLFLISAAISLLFFQTFFSSEGVKAKGLVIFDLPPSEQIENILNKRTNNFSKLVHNKYVYISTKFIKNYSKTFSKEFFLTRGGGNPSYNISGYGNFHLIETLSLLLGLAFLLRSKNKYGRLLFFWFFIAPIPGAITREAVHSTREAFLLPISQIIAGIGSASLLVKMKTSKKTVNIFISLMLITSIPFFTKYFNDYSIQSDHIYHGYIKEVVEDAKNQKERFNSIIFTNYPDSPYIFYAFYHKLDPNIFHETIKYHPNTWEGFKHAASLDGVHFQDRDEEEIILKNIQKENNLIYSRPNTLEEWIRPLNMWDNLDGEVEIVSWKENQI
ncbi:hypothetical protein ACFL1M_04870 [Patescibacteria group bacterium]